MTEHRPQPVRDPSCAFCRIVAGEVDADVVLDDGPVLAFLDHRPVFPGHVLVVPRAHVPTLVDLDDELLVPLMSAVRAVAAAVPRALGAQGTFVAANNVVSQSVPHLHWHVVPRTKGDGLRGFFWPRTSYASDEERTAIATVVRDALDDQRALEK